MDTLVQDVSCVMAALDTHGARDLVNANHVFERLEAISTDQAKVGTELVNLVVHSFLVDLGMAPAEAVDGAEIVVIEDNCREPENPDTCRTASDDKTSSGDTSSEDTVSGLNVTEKVRPIVKVEVPEVSAASSEALEELCQLLSEDPLPGLVMDPPINVKEEAKLPCVNVVPETAKICTRLHDPRTGAIPKSSSVPSNNQINLIDSQNGIRMFFEDNTYKSVPLVARLSPKRSSEDLSEPHSDKKKIKFVLENESDSVNGAAAKRPDDFNGLNDSEDVLNESFMDQHIPPPKKSKPTADRVSNLSEMFPEADPQYLWDKCEEIKDDEAYNNLIMDMLQSNDYPRVFGVTKNRKNASAAAGSERDLDRNDNASGIIASSAATKYPAKMSTSHASSTITSASVLSKAPSAGAEWSLQAPGPSSKALTVTVTSQAPQKVPQGPASSSTSACTQELIAGPSTSTLMAPNASELKHASSLSEVTRRMGADVTEEKAPPREPWQDQHDFLLQILPDADPSFLEEKARTLFDKEDDLRNFVAQVLEDKEYPSRKDWLWRQEQLALQKRYTKEFSIPNFLEVIPDPFTYFSDPKRKCSNKSQASMFLRNKYRKLKIADITSVFNSKEQNLTLTCRALDNWGGATLKGRRTQVDHDLTKSEGNKGIDVPFLQEIAFIENEQKIVAYLNEKKTKREQRFNEAKEKGDLLQCQCCYDDEVLLEDVRTCSEGHIFCVTCLQKSSEQRIGDGHTTFPCLADCQAEFNLQVLQGVLKPTVFSRLVQRKQTEEVKAAGIEDLVLCPFCDFCNIPPKDDKVFRCLNPDCMKESCRLCKEESHVPLRCEEVEKKTDVEMRTYIENKMTEALVRTCWKCQKKFVKEDGCNKMTCQCGAMMCYICRQPVKDYSHFNGQGGDAHEKCPLYADHRALEAAEVKKIAEQAKQEVLARLPNASLKHDPTKLLPLYNQKAPHDGGDDYDSDDSEDSEGYFDDDGQYQWHVRDYNFGGGYLYEDDIDEEENEEEEAEEEDEEVEDEEMEVEEEEEEERDRDRDFQRDDFGDRGRFDFRRVERLDSSSTLSLSSSDSSVEI